MDWNSFWINIIAGGIYFTLGILFSIWLIPIFTIRLLKSRNREFIRQKISFLISEFCDFFNNMPNDFKANDNSTVFYVVNKKYPDLRDFVALLKPNLFEPAAYEKTIYLIAKCVAETSGQKRHNLVKVELDRMSSLLVSIENLIGIHSLNFNDNLINRLSLVSFDIRLMRNKFKFNNTVEELTGEKEGIFGADKIKDIYEKLFEILDLMSREKDITRE